MSQMHYARKGIITPEMEFVSLRESMMLERLFDDPAYASLLAATQRMVFWCAASRTSDA